MYASPDETLVALEREGYFTDLKTATTVYLAGRLHRPVLLEGPAGAGKTELAASVARSYRVPLLRLQCYQGINEEKAIGQYDKSLQELYVLLTSKSDRAPDWTEIKREVTSRAYFIAGPLLEAIEQNQRCVLLIDEIDKVDYAFEAMLLELLSVWTLSIPKMGTVHATSIPHVFLTSNQERRLGDPLRRRSFYLVVEHPTAEREAAIVARRTPDADEKTHRFIAGLAKSLRAYTMEKPPSISEMNDVALAMQLLGIEQIRPEHKDIMLPLIAKTEGDRKRLLMRQAFESIVRIAGRYASEVSPEEVTDIAAIFAEKAEA
ncbi:MoxR-like ATPase [Edaphobacter aggregans]|jgi:MoxR-like ATPase|uniref:MoxR-like ATPase n=1 Tax=Edaphobacter aggregans TaxID=570835 RepID=A0A3R9R631_9BACT|nr:MoxR family ATPase [Edaphobacter aggregans]RSL18816.1 MoxR-like ATPase [Edaphobacter aggregans]